MAGPGGLDDGWAGVSATMIERVADAEGCSPAELEPLYDAVDPDALDRLVGPGTRAEGSVRRIVFEYRGSVVTVRGDGSVGLSQNRRGDADE